jgi:hypothetical protein
LAVSGRSSASRPAGAATTGPAASHQHRVGQPGVERPRLVDAVPGRKPVAGLFQLHAPAAHHHHAAGGIGKRGLDIVVLAVFRLPVDRVAGEADKLARLAFGRVEQMKSHQVSSRLRRVGP